IQGPRPAVDRGVVSRGGGGATDPALAVRCAARRPSLRVGPRRGSRQRGALASHAVPHCRANGRGLCSAWGVQLRRADFHRNGAGAGCKASTAVAWDVLRELRPELDVSKQAFLAESPAIRLDAFENYVRGVLAGTRAEKVRYLKQALRLHPAYAQAMIQLGSAYYEAKDYEQAANWFSKIPSSDKLARQANFHLGLCAYYLGQYERAEAAFRLVASQLPLTQVYN